MITLTDQAFDPADALRDFTATSHGAGGIVSFSGHVRPQSGSGAVSALHLESHPVMTERGIEDAAKQAGEQWSLIATRIIHRVGTIATGEAIVFVATAATHRREAFLAADYLMDYLKTDAIFWKKETGPSGDVWIEPRQQDYTDRARWAHTGDT